MATTKKTTTSKTGSKTKTASVKTSKTKATTMKKATTTQKATTKAKSASRTTAAKKAEMQITHEMIAERAYFMFMKRGSQHGMHIEDWVEAEKQLQSEQAILN